MTVGCPQNKLRGNKSRALGIRPRRSWPTPSEDSTADNPRNVLFSFQKTRNWVVLDSDSRLLCQQAQSWRRTGCEMMPKRINIIKHLTWRRNHLFFNNFASFGKCFAKFTFKSTVRVWQIVSRESFLRKFEATRNWMSISKLMDRNSLAIVRQSWWIAPSRLNFHSLCVDHDSRGDWKATIWAEKKQKSFRATLERAFSCFF